MTRLLLRFYILGVAFLFPLTFAQAVTISVPQDLLTIQGAIDAAVQGDTVLVAPGTYFENIHFRGKEITVASEAGADKTIIDGSRLGSVVTFDPSQGSSATLRGFTVQNGDSPSGGGLASFFSSPTIIDNKIINNTGCGDGIGIYIYQGAALIQRNLIAHNFRTTACSGGAGGGGILVFGSYTQILDNIISDNYIGNGGGAGISVQALGVTIRGNIIKRNRTSMNPPECTWGGGIKTFSDVSIVQNLITENVACLGGGIYWLLPFGSTNPLLVNNTIADNDSPLSSGVYAGGFDAKTPFINNIIVAKAGQRALWCNNNVLAPGIFKFNNIYTPVGTPYELCPFQITGVDGNISADPLFVDPLNGNYHLRAGSPSVDAGDNTAPGLTESDLDGNRRISDGDHDGIARIDMGVDELGPLANAGPDQIVQCSSPNGTQVALDGTGSSAPDPDTVIFTWTGAFGTATGPTPTVTLPLGVNTITLQVDAGLDGISLDTVTVTLQDTTPPNIISASAIPSVLEPPNHHMVPVSFSALATDLCSGPATCRILSVSSNEPQDGLGDGDTSPDWIILEDLSATLRAERSGTGNGRIYTITIACQDGSGNSSTKTVQVTVPR
jgi:hypothetical protein